MAKFFATVVLVVEADNDSAAREFTEQLIESPDFPEEVLEAWVDNVEEAEEMEDEDEPGEAWGDGLDD